MEFLVEFESHIPSGTPETEIRERYAAEASRRPASTGQSTLRSWKPSSVPSACTTA